MGNGICGLLSQLLTCSLLTTLNAPSNVTSAQLDQHQLFLLRLSFGLLFGALVMDYLDGKIARLTAPTMLGQQLDSLCDLVLYVILDFIWMCPCLAWVRAWPTVKTRHAHALCVCIRWNCSISQV
jgi:phosphatidylserine synthase